MALENGKPKPDSISVIITREMAPAIIKMLGHYRTSCTKAFALSSEPEVQLRVIDDLIALYDFEDAFYLSIQGQALTAAENSRLDDMPEVQKGDQAAKLARQILTETRDDLIATLAREQAELLARPATGSAEEHGKRIQARLRENTPRPPKKTDIN